MATTTYEVPGIMCDGCANAIKRALGDLAAVSEVDVDVPGKRVTVDYDDAKVEPAEIAQRIENAGYEVGGH